MAAPTAEELEDLAAGTGHQDRTLEMVVRLFDIMNALTDDDSFSNRLALKGGAPVRESPICRPRP